MKQCVKCNELKPLLLFPVRGNDCKACVAIYMKNYRQLNATRIAELKRTWKNNNLEHVRDRDNAYAKANPEKRRIARAKWRVANPHVINALTKKRRATMIHRTPKWVDAEELWLIQEVYRLASDRTRLHGFSWHVDHIIPLQGKTVCGLHTMANLQVIPGIENIRKGINYAQ